MNDQEKIELIYRYAADHPAFGTDFVDSLQSQLSYRELTEAQQNALDNIIDRYRMESLYL